MLKCGLRMVVITALGHLSHTCTLLQLSGRAFQIAPGRNELLHVGMKHVTSSNSHGLIFAPYPPFCLLDPHTPTPIPLHFWDSQGFQVLANVVLPFLLSPL